MKVNLDSLLNNYHVTFEGLRHPVFYYDLYPTNGNKKSEEEWDRFYFGQGLKLKSNPPYVLENKTHVTESYDRFKEKYKEILIEFLGRISKENPSAKIAVMTIPSSDKENTNVVTRLVSEILNNRPFPNVYNCTGAIIRTKSKPTAHEDGNRDIKQNQETLILDERITTVKIDIVVIIDDLVTSGSSFNAIASLIDHQVNAAIINFAFCRSLSLRGHENFDRWNNEKINKSDDQVNHEQEVAAVIFDYDQTLVDTSVRAYDFEGVFPNIEISGRNPKYRDFIKEHRETYQVYPGVKDFFEENIPFAIVSNSGRKRLRFLWQLENLKKGIYPSFSKTTTEDFTDEDRKIIAQYTKNSSESSWYFNDLPQRSPFNYPDNMFAAPSYSYTIDDEEKYGYHSKPSEKGVIEARNYLIETFNLDESSRIIGLGNTLEDMIAYHYAGVESALALWGVPKELRHYARNNWGADHVFPSFNHFSQWLKDPSYEHVNFFDEYNKKSELKYSSERLNTENETYQLYQKGLPVEKIAEIRGFKESTIYSHLEKLIQRRELLDFKATNREAYLKVTKLMLQQMYEYSIEEKMSEVFSDINTKNYWIQAFIQDYDLLPEINEKDLVEAILEFKARSLNNSLI